MALSNYTELKAAVAQWMRRADLTAEIPDYITLAEKKIVKLLKIRGQETETTLTPNGGDSTVALPTDYGSPIALWNALADRIKLNQVLPDALEYDDTPGTPDYWAVDGTNIRFDCRLDGAIPFAFRYVKTFELSDVNPTNFILTEWPDVYLYGALTEGFLAVYDEQRAAVWQGKFQAAIEVARTTGNDSKKSIALRTDMGAQRFNIYTGE